MKRSLLVGIVFVCLMSSSAFAKSRSYSAEEDFSAASSADIQTCVQTAATLSALSSDDLSVSITDNCKFHKRAPKGLRILSRVLMDIGTWGFNEIACERNGGCGEDSQYSSLQAKIELSSSIGRFVGRPVAMSDQDCQTYAAVLSNLVLSSPKAHLTTQCDKGYLNAWIDVSK